MRFALVVPVLNEEQAIAATLRRVLAAREGVLTRTSVTAMSVVVVNDGSSDRTQEIIDQPEFDEVIKIRFLRNWGYGAAIKAGWRATDAEILGFIDADGTCDPDYAVDLINRLEVERADVVLASRLHADSKMPWIRRLGNILFARLLGAVSRRRLTDCASGFRIVRRSSLRLISPLPNRLHFTPAMSAICLLDPRLRIEEVPMPYQERIGRSKLSVLKDGLRFLYIIGLTTCCYTPLRTMLVAAGLWILVLGAVIRLLQGFISSEAASLLTLGGALVAMLAVWTGVVCHQLNYLLIGPRHHLGWAERVLLRLVDFKLLILSGALLLAMGLLGLIYVGHAPPAGGERVASVPLFVLVFGATSVLVGMIVRVVWAVGEKQKALVGDEFRPEPPTLPEAGSIPAYPVDPARFEQLSVS
jgi:glycosyltransferase involved in cell wall biosynthesis